MKAVVCQNAELTVRDLSDPALEKGQVRLKVLRCGICGSDLHVRHHCDLFGSVVKRAGYPNSPKASDALVFGHEFCGEVLEHGPGTPKNIKAGTRVCAVPAIRKGKEIDILGLSERAPGAYAERVVVEETLMMPVPNGLSSDMAALAEPMSVGLHAVNRSEIKKKEVAIVIGCGPVGLAIVCMLKAKGVRTVIASDFSPGRRALAKKCGADIVINPADESPFSTWEQYGFIGGLDGLLELAMGTREKLGKLPVAWWHTWRLAENLGVKPPAPVIFECVGVPGVLKNIIDGAPLLSRVVVVGVCMTPDTLDSAMGNYKEVDVRFTMGASPLEYRDALHMIAEGKVRCEHLVTGIVGLDGVENAFEALRDPETHAKILIDPSRQQATPARP
ncbi:MAG: alcohol dehydrogenase [Rhodoferax sp.]|nr:MAG: alcohol dehydrogenase [Rhodoferax sp.]